MVKSTWECPCLRSGRGEVGGDFVFRTAGEPYRKNVHKGRVGTLAGRGQPGQLALVLHRAQHRQAIGEARVARAGQRALQPEQVQRPGAVGDRVPTVSVQKRRGRGVRVRAVEPVDHGQGGRTVGLLRVRPLQARHHQRRLPPRGEHEGGEPFGDRGRRVAAEVDEVGPGRDDQPGEARLGGGRGGALHPLGVVVGGEGGRHAPMLRPAGGASATGTCDTGTERSGAGATGAGCPFTQADASAAVSRRVRPVVSSSGLASSSTTSPRAETTRQTEANMVSSPTNAAAVVSEPSPSRYRSDTGRTGAPASIADCRVAG